MKPENQNNDQPPIELAPQDAALIAHIDAGGRHGEAVHAYHQTSVGNPESVEARDRREQRAREFELADMRRQTAERTARRSEQRERAASVISGLFGRRR